jgi:two-component system cell cycle sensor histidine kinase/response regulator CckA
MKKIKQETRNETIAEWQKVMESTMASSINPFAIADLEGNLTYANNSFLKMCGYDNGKEILGRSAGEFWKMKEKDLQAMKVLREKSSWMGELLAKKKDGSTFDVYLLANMVTDETNKPMCVMVSFIDMTERKKAEEEIRKLLETIETAKEAISITSADGTIMYTNCAMDELFGYRRGELLGEKPLVLNAGPDPVAVMKDIMQGVKKEGTWEGEIHNKRKDGTEFMSYARISALKDKNGELINFLSTQHDITKHKKAEAELMLAQKLASVGQLAAGIAHEINNPLSVLCGEIQWLLEGSKDKKLIKSLKSMDRVCKRIALIVNNLLTFSRETATKVVKLSNINSLIERTLSLMERRFKLINIKIVKKFDKSLPGLIMNKGQIEQVFMNILLNSLGAMPNGGKLTISTKLSSTKDAVEVIFVDTGSGIAKEDLSKIFDPFFSTKPTGRGTGLGLSVSHGIIKNHGGSIKIDSELNRGTKVLIRLPIKQEKR